MSIINFFLVEKNIKALGLIYLALVWLSLIKWVAQDCAKRTTNILVKLFSILLVLILGPFGFILYLLLRPAETLEDSFNREVEAEVLSQIEKCPVCEEVTHDDWLFCPTCFKKLKNICKRCKRLNEITWSICPYCGYEEKIKKVLLEPKDKKNGKNSKAKKKA